MNVVGDGGPTVSQTKAYADAEDAEFQLGADLEERGGMVVCCMLYAVALCCRAGLAEGRAPCLP